MEIAAFARQHNEYTTIIRFPQPGQARSISERKINIPILARTPLHHLVLASNGTLHSNVVESDYNLFR